MLKNFILQHKYFSIVWKSLSLNERNEIIEILSSGKGFIPYKKTTTMNSLDSKPENQFFWNNGILQ